MGATAFDVESYKIDANGNHHLFYTGFNRYELAYRNATNQVASVKLDWPIELNALSGEKVFAMKHDAQGNVVQALHKNIQHIEYHPVSQRTTRIQLTDNRTLRFYYDAQGERVLKRVFDAEGTISHETHYLRDEQGKVLMDRQTNYVDGTPQKMVTAYLYGPRGLLGFVRNEGFYSVTTDHSGSIRLVIKNGSVVAAYDYLPYGGLMRSYGNDPQAHIVYRYTGQEWDEETGLYNYHARLYDPSIGRFYQIDPKAQYFSPYKYAGNSPISVVDPDGEFAFLLIACIGFGVFGGYLGGAAANNRWNPVDWDFKDSGTWLGIVGGGIAGGLAPLGAVASVSAIGGLVGGSVVVGVIGTVGLGVGVGYLSTAAASGSWDPSQWKWDRPDTWSALFQGAAAGAGIAGGIGTAHSFANGGKVIKFLSNLKVLKAIGIGQRAVKGMFLTVSYTAGGGVAYLRAGAANNNFAFWEWDWTNPATFSGLVDGFDTGMGWPQNIMEMGRGVGKFVKNPSKVLFSGQKSFKLKAILKDSKHPLYRTTTSVVMAYYMGSAANGDFDITKWNLAVFSTYEGVLNGAFFGKDITKTLKYIRDSKVQQPSHALEHNPKNKANEWSSGLNNLLESIPTDRIGEKYQHQLLVAQAFAESASWLSKLSDQSDSVRIQVENFFKRGLRKWQSGESRPPEALERLIAEEAKLKVQEDSALTIWKTESEEALRKQQEVFPDEEDRAFLNCGGRARRRKRSQGDNNSCTTTALSGTPDSKTTVVPKQELGQQLLEIKDPGISTDQDQGGVYKLIQRNSNEGSTNSNGFNPSSPQGFAQHFSLLLHKIPMTHGPIQSDFLPNLILGSILTQNSNKAVYAKIETVPVTRKRQGPPTRKNTEPTPLTHKILKICFKEKDTLVLRTFIAEDRKLGITDKDPAESQQQKDGYKKQLDDESKYSQAELHAINEKLGNGEYTSIQENVFYIDTKHELTVKSSLLTEKPDHGTLLKSNSDATTIVIVDANIIRPGENNNNNVIPRNELDAYLKKISSDKIEEVQGGIKEFSENLLKIYHEKAQTFGFDPKSESAFHGFLYGALSLGFKYKYNLDIKVEAISGRGYADLMLLSRHGEEEGNNKNWRAIPIVIELKADKTSASGATAQTIGTGYLYNLSMRTVAENAVVVGINSRTKEVTVSEELIPQSEGFIQKLIKIKQQGEEDNSAIQTALETELKHLYYSISPLAIKEHGNHYLSRLILGEILSSQNRKIHVQRDGALSTFVFQEGGKWIMLNLVESQASASKNINPKMPDGLDINQYKLLRVDVKVNPKSKNGWSDSKPKSTVAKNQSGNNNGNYFFQKLEVINTLPNTEKVQYNTLTNQADLSNLFTSENKVQGADQVNIESRKKIIENQLEKLSADIKNPENIIKSESDFQAVLQGLFLGLAKQVDSGKIIKVFPEANLSKEGRSDLIICMLKRTNDQIHEEGIILMELKYTDEQKLCENLLGKAEQQVLKYGPHLKLLTDLSEVTPIAAVCCPMSFKVLDPRRIAHTSGNVDLSMEQIDPKDWSQMLGPSASAAANEYEIDQSGSFLKRENPYDDENNQSVGQSGSKKPKQTYRRKRSLEYVEVHGNETTLHIQIESKRLVNNPLTYVPSTTQVVAPYKGNVEALNPLNNNLAVASSGSSKLQFWPVHMVQKAGQAIVSILSINWLSSSKEKVHEDPAIGNLLQSEPLVQQPMVKPTAVGNTLLAAQVALSAHQQPPFNTSTTGPSLLEMGDQWVKNTDTNGLLTWGILLARKWTGYRPKAFQVPSHDPAMDIHLDIRSHECVDAFMDQVQKQAQACGIAKATATAIFVTPKSYTQAIETVRKKIATGPIEGITALLFDKIVQQHLSKMAAATTPKQAGQLLAKVKATLPKLEQQFLQQAVTLQNYPGAAQANTRSKANIGLLNQAMCSMPPIQLADSNLHRGTIHHTHNTLVQSPDHGNLYRKCAGL